MTTAHLPRAVRTALARLRPSDLSGPTDGELLDQFLASGDGSAFALLVRRHGPTVLGVCRRILGNSHDADDAFQATFLVLARKAGSVRPRDRVGAWLYGVACRTALKARSRDLRRREVERTWVARNASTGSGTAGSAEALAALDQLVTELPEKYRLPLVLCGVQRLGKKEAADRLGWAEGTVSSRLARARELLRDRFARRGFILPSAALAALLTQDTLQAAISAATAEVTAESAIRFLGGEAGAVSPGVLNLTHEVLRTMTFAKWKLLSVVALSAALAGGGFGVALADEKKPQKPAPEKKAEKPRPEAGEKPKPGADKKPAKEQPAGSTWATITLGQGTDKKTAVVLKSADAAVLVNGKLVSPSDLKPGDKVAVVVIVPEQEGKPEKGKPTPDKKPEPQKSEKPAPEKGAKPEASKKPAGDKVPDKAKKPQGEPQPDKPKTPTADKVKKPEGGEQPQKRKKPVKDDNN